MDKMKLQLSLKQTHKRRNDKKKIYEAAHLPNNCIFDKFLSIEQVTSFFDAAIIWIGWVTCWGTGSIPISKPVDLI